VIGLYVNSPDHAVVFAVEKAAIQALESHAKRTET
jgi:hypothetical protein